MEGGGGGEREREGNGSQQSEKLWNVKNSKKERILIVLFKIMKKLAFKLISRKSC